MRERARARFDDAVADDDDEDGPFGADPFQEAVSVTQHIWPAALPENAPGENDNDPDRPWALTLSSRPTTR